MSVVSAGCSVWLQRFQPLFAALAIGTLVYQAWLVWRRPASPANSDDAGDSVDQPWYNGRDRHRHARALAAISIAIVTVCSLPACDSPPAAQAHDGFRRVFAQVRGIT